MAKKQTTKTLKGENFDLEVHYSDYLNMINTPEYIMLPEQKKQVKNAFYGGALSLYQIIVHDVNELPEAAAVDVLENLYKQMIAHFEKQIAKE